MAFGISKIALALGAAMTLSLTHAAAAQEAPYVPPPEEMEMEMAIMEAMFPSDTREDQMLELAGAMGNQVAQGMMEGPAFEEPGIRVIVDEFLADLPETLRPAISKHLPAMIESTAIAYTREFSLEELEDLRAFAETPSGQRYFANVQSLLTDPAVAQANQAFFQDVAVVQQQKTREIQQRVINYLQANPDVLQRLQNAGVGSGS